MYRFTAAIIIVLIAITTSIASAEELTRKEMSIITIDKLKPGLIGVSVPHGIDFEISPEMNVWNLVIEEKRTWIYFHAKSMEVCYDKDVDRIKFDQHQTGPGFSVNPTWKVHVKQ